MKCFFIALVFFALVGSAWSVPVRVKFSVSNFPPNENYSAFIFLGQSPDWDLSDYVLVNFVTDSFGSARGIALLDWDSSIPTDVYCEFYGSADYNFYSLGYIYLDSVVSFHIPNYPMLVTLTLEPLSSSSEPDFLSVSNEIKYFSAFGSGLLLFLLFASKFSGDIK